MNDLWCRIQDVSWTKNGHLLDINGSEGKYIGGNVDKPSLIISNANQEDAGTYKFNATYNEGLTDSDEVVLGIYILNIFDAQNFLNFAFFLFQNCKI